MFDAYRVFKRKKKKKKNEKKRSGRRRNQSSISPVVRCKRSFTVSPYASRYRIVEHAKVLKKRVLYLIK